MGAVIVILKKLGKFADFLLDRQVTEIVRAYDLLNRPTDLPVYADNTAALAGGLTAGARYRTSTGVLMVVC